MTARSKPAARIALSDQLVDAAANLALQPQRTALALLGIMIGTACVVALLTIGHMAEREALKIFSAAGVNMLVLQATLAGPNAGGTATLDDRILHQLPQRKPDILAVAGAATGNLPVSLDGPPIPVSVAAVEPDLQALSGLKVKQGRLFMPVEIDSPVALVGADLAQRLSLTRGLGPGQKIRLGRYIFVVIGVLAPRQASAFDPSDFNGGVVVPLQVGRRILDSPNLNAAVLRLRPGADAKATGAWLTNTFQAAMPATAVQVQSARGLIATFKAQKAVQARFLAAIGAVSLLVGGIGVMNVMLMSVMERRREIGLRAAIGAKRRDIQIMFLAEAIVLAVGGGVSGTLLGLVAAYAAALLSHWTFSMALYALPLGCGVAILVGVVFGLYPAVRASKLKPIEALRSE
jgi:putative ABC transport system permease protein